MNDTVWLTPKELCARWRGLVSEKTLANWRCQKRGPVPLRLGGKVIYPLDRVVAYENEAFEPQARTRRAKGTGLLGRPSKAELERREMEKRRLAFEQALADLDKELASIQQRRDALLRSIEVLEAPDS